MSETNDLAALLAAVPDEDLLTIVATATIGRPALERLHRAAAELTDTTGTAPSPSPSPSTAPAPAPVTGGFDPPPASGVGSMPPGSTDAGYSESGIPTFESVRDKVDQRFGTAQGMGELSAQTPAGRGAEEQWQARDEAARERLDRIRESVRDSDSG